jgi:subtilase-type serine protease
MESKHRINFLLAAFAAVLLATTAGQSTHRAAVWASELDTVQLQTLNVPLSQFPDALSTYLTGIRGDLITGFFTVAGGESVAVVYDRTSGLWTPLQVPLAAATEAYGPDLTSSSYRVVGSYKNNVSESTNQGFLYDAATNSYTTLNAPETFCGTTPCNSTILHSIYGDANYALVGNCTTSTGSGTEDWSEYPAISSAPLHAFLYDSKSQSFSEIDVPEALSTTAYGIWIGEGVVAVAGGYTDLTGIHAYVRSLSSRESVVYNFPGASITHFEGITGAGAPGNYNVIGDYADLKTKNVAGFFLPIRNWQAGAPVVIGKVSANSVFQHSVIGVYGDAGQVNGYLAQVP